MTDFKKVTKFERREGNYTDFAKYLNDSCFIQLSTMGSTKLGGILPSRLDAVAPLTLEKKVIADGYGDTENFSKSLASKVLRRQLSKLFFIN